MGDREYSKYPEPRKSLEKEDEKEHEDYVDMSNNKKKESLCRHTFGNPMSFNLLQQSAPRINMLVNRMIQIVEASTPQNLGTEVFCIRCDWLQHFRSQCRAGYIHCEIYEASECEKTGWGRRRIRRLSVCLGRFHYHK